MAANRSIDPQVPDVFRQGDIRSKLTIFCEKYNDDISWKVDAQGVKTTDLSSAYVCTEKRFSPELIKLVKDSDGNCSGLTCMFLARAYLTAMQAESKTVKNQDDLRKFYSDVKAITSWDGHSELAPETQALFRAFLYQMFQFQKSYNLLDIPQEALDKMLLLSEESDFPFVREEVYVMTVTQEQLREKLSLLNQPNRLTYISSGNHIIGRFNNLFFDSNYFYDGYSYHSEKDLARLCFHHLPFKNPEQPQLIGIVQFKHRLALAADYPPHEEMLRDCSNPSAGLRMASQLNDLKSLKVYLSKPGCDVNAVDKDDWNPLRLASRNGHADVVRVLLERKDCDVNAVDKDGWNSLRLASRYGHADVVRVLLERKDCDVSAVDKEGWNALMFASARGHVDVVHALLKRKDCDVNAVRRGWSALAVAVDEGHMDIARMLIAHGATIVTLLQKALQLPFKTLRALNELEKQKELNLVDPVIRDYINKSFFNVNRASALSQIERERLQDKTLQRILTKEMLTLEQVLALTPLEIAALKISRNTLDLLPANLAHEVKDEANDLRAIFVKLKKSLDQWTEEKAGAERKNDPDFADQWLVNVQAVLNVDIETVSLSDLCSDLNRVLTPLKKQHTNQVLLATKFVLGSMKSSMSEINPGFLFKTAKNYYVELNAVLDSKMAPDAKLDQIRKSLHFATQNVPNVEPFKKMKKALNDDYPYCEIFKMKKEIEEAGIKSGVRLARSF